MKYAISYSPNAIRDLDRVKDEVLSASSSDEIAERYIDGLLDAVEAKTDFPKSGKPLYYEDIFIGYYIVIFKEYLAFYRLEGSSMLVDRVLFSGSDYMRILHISI